MSTNHDTLVFVQTSLYVWKVEAKVELYSTLGVCTPLMELMLVFTFKEGPMPYPAKFSASIKVDVGVL